jgi:hypothetical protein
VAPVRAQDESRLYQFHVWQIESDGSRFSQGGFQGGGWPQYDFRMWIKPDRRILETGGYRLDADFVVHWLGDTTVLLVDVAAIRELSRHATPSDSGTRTRLEEESYRRSLVLLPGTSAWFYPFGIPKRGERGIAYEVTMADSSLSDMPFDREHEFLLSGHDYGVEFGPRLHRVRIRLEIGTDSTGWRRVFEGPGLTRLPVRVPLAREGAREQTLVFELEDPEWSNKNLKAHDQICWRWSWVDRTTRGGGSCTSINRGTSVQRLYGSNVGELRVTILSAE